MQFSAPATLKFNFDPTGVDTTTLAIYYFDGVAWSSAAVANQRVIIDTSTSAYLEGEISHTSMYALLRKKAETANVVGVVLSPSTLNLDSRGGYITADLSFISGTGCFRPETVAISAVNGIGLGELVYAQRPGGGKRRVAYELHCGSATLKFDREAVSALLPANAVVTLTVSGTLDGGAAFSAEDTVRTIKHFKAGRGDKWHYSHKCGAYLDGEAGSLREDRELFMLKVERDLAWKEALKDRAASVAGLRRHGAAFEFGPEGLKFETPVTVSLPYDASVKNPERLAVAYWNEQSSAWERLASRVDRSGRLVKADVDHFSQYQVMEATMPVSGPGESKGFRVREDDSVQAAASQEFRLGAVYVYPDPAKGGKVPTFHIEVGTADTVKIRVYAVSGQLAHEAALGGAPQAAGGGYAYEYQWTGRIASGVYYYTVEAERGGKKLKAKGKFAVVR